MKKHIITILWLAAFGISAYMGYKYSTDLFKAINPDITKLTIKNLIYMFSLGATLTGLIFEILSSNTSNSLDAYKRELEKESISSTESSSRIKVLESKIEVLEKALDEALKK